LLKLGQTVRILYFYSFAYKGENLLCTNGAKKLFPLSLTFCLFLFFHQFLEHRSSSLDDDFLMGTKIAGNFWQQYEKYAEDALSRPTLVAIIKMREKLMGSVAGLRHTFSSLFCHFQT
jgi:hypothetical protein